MKQTLVLLVLYFSAVLTHSWVSCTHYDRSSGTDSSVYNAGKCTGFGRGWARTCEYTNNQFGLDCGYNQQNANQVCPTPLNSANYNSTYSTQSPMAVYAPGETVCLAWPAKNHVAASCVNVNIPDFGTKVYMSAANPTADPTSVNDLRSNFRMIEDLGTNPGADAYLGFQNCPRFCQDNDKCLCTGCFRVPLDAQQGAVYSFFWAWAFNNLADTYTTCWEAKISGQAITTVPPTPTRTSPPSGTNRATSASTSRSTSTSTSASTSRSTSTSRTTSTSAQSSRAQTTNDNGNTQSQDNACSSINVPAYCKEVCGTNSITECTCNNGDVSAKCGDEASSAIALSSLFSFLFYLLL
eukprot:TRINITY_DN1044_c0_g1_i1.p1 TRINITY_DN1044_c0_g1~~TRINITY_DN1044_c0_g1_i1.p1  ORF type:complete len:353 (-),score=65.02 TRINITY_DN1044_c0_g1_i1:26-1084(-)